MPLPLAAIATIAAPLVSSGIASIFGKRDNDRRNRELEKSISPFSDLLSQEKNRGRNGYLQTTEAKSFMNTLGRMSEDQRMSLANIASLGNMTDEAQLAGLNKVNENEAQGINGMIGQATNFREQNLSNQNSLLSQIFSMRNGGQRYNENMSSANTQRVGAGLNGALSGILSSFSKT